MHLIANPVTNPNTIEVTNPNTIVLPENLNLSSVAVEPFVLNSERLQQIAVTTASASEKKPMNFTEEIAEEFFKQIQSLNLNGVQTDKVFKTATALLSNFHFFCRAHVSTNPHNAVEILDVCNRDIVGELEKFNTEYKRQNFFKKQPDYIRPTPLAIGTHMEIKRDAKSKVRMPTHVQSSYNYVPLLETLQTLFSNEKLCQLYFEYNAMKKHVCSDGIYKDFCCGSKFKSNELFKKFPDSLQIQLFVDGFELCDPLKTKTNVVVGFYFAIRNMPPELAYHLENIHLLAMVNDYDLKKNETNYSNVLEVIAREVQNLETIGIDIGRSSYLRGIICI